LVQAQNVQTVVIGLPRNMDGTYGAAAQKVREFIAQIQPHLSAKMICQDERLTTVQASRDLSQIGINQKELRKKVDSASACLILQQFLDRPRLDP
jgi:putative Holliday junction resolvase